VKATQFPTRGILNEEARADTIAMLHEQLQDRFDRYSQDQKVQWYDNGSVPTSLHQLFDRLAEEASLFISGLDVDDQEMALERVVDADPLFKTYHRSKSMTVLVERYSILIDTLRAAAMAAAAKNDWKLTDLCSEFAHRFEESLWFMVVYLQENWADEATVPTPTGE